MTITGHLDLNFERADTLYLTHGLHAFPAKCPPQLVRWALERYSAPGDLVVDPFCGSGTTLVEARLNGRASIGIDLDPLCCLISQVKVEPLDDEQLASASEYVLSRVTALLEVEPQALLAPSIHNRERWFLPEVSYALAALKVAIQDLRTSDSIRRFFYLALSSLIVARSSVANARDLVHSRHHFNAHATPPDVLGRFARRCKTMRRQVAAFGAQASVELQAEVIRADTRALPLQDGIARLIFTSPPYCNALDYTRTHALAVAWLADVLGTSIDEYRLLGRRYIGTDRARKSHRLNGQLDGFDSPTAAWAVMQVGAADPVSAGVLARYFVDMRQALAECSRVLLPGGHLVLVICPSRIRGVDVPTHRALAEIAATLPAPLELVGEYERTMDDRRRVMPYLSVGFGQRMRTEYVLALRRTERGRSGVGDG